MWKGFEIVSLSIKCYCKNNPQVRFSHLSPLALITATRRTYAVRNEWDQRQMMCSFLSDCDFANFLTVFFNHSNYSKFCTSKIYKKKCENLLCNGITFFANKNIFWSIWFCFNWVNLIKCLFPRRLGRIRHSQSLNIYRQVFKTLVGIYKLGDGRKVVYDNVSIGKKMEKNERKKLKARIDFRSQALKNEIKYMCNVVYNIR